MIEFYLARRYLFRGRAKHLSYIGIISCMGIAIGVATLIVVISVMNGFGRDLMARLMKFNYHLTIESFDREELPGIKAELEGWDEVEIVSLVTQTQIFAKFGSQILPLVVKGIDLRDAKEREYFYQYLTCDFKNDGFFLGESLKEKYYIRETISFYPLKKRLKVQEEKIAGFFKVGLYDIDNYYVITDINKVKSLSPNYLSFLGLRLDEPFAADRLKKKIKNNFSQGVFINTWMESNRDLFSALKLEKIVFFILVSLITVVASFVIFAILTIKVVEKTKDIGILKSLGFTKGKILTIFSLQGLLLGTIGVISGSFLGLGLCFILKKYPFIKLPEIYSIEYLPIAINYREISLIVFLGLLLSYVFSLLPALRASRLSPCEALRYE
ncbi:MAG: ABC transporter permease [Candidatus Omnitrophica bacterium]|nr:ABC transporter permease [Candidatus Omnitrophota bacterium]